MSPLRKTFWHDEDEASESGPVTLRSARFEVAARLSLPVEVVTPADREERSGVRPTAEILHEALGVLDDAADFALSDDLEMLSADTDPVFDDEVIFVDEDEEAYDDEPDTVRMPPLAHDEAFVHDTDPPPPTLRSSQMRCAKPVSGAE